MDLRLRNWRRYFFINNVKGYTMNLKELLLISISSALSVSGLVMFLVKKILENSLKFQFDKKIEELKNKLQIVATDILKPRIEGYGKLASQVYLLRNKCRKIVTEKETDHNAEIYKILQEKINDLINLLVVYRGYFEDPIFEKAHKFKNKLLLFMQLIDDMHFYKNHNEIEKFNLAQIELAQLYHEIDIAHKEIIKNLGITDIPFNIKD